ncbi:uncharacterized protein LOC102152485 [Canis lupus familiaris]|uniref:uncharacterized protein LOC102152485 n=1 Tax=Canis lupus familiaris TaxID=9615 RepID=UPI0003AD7C01|nr:uncharacterized protein LOC102152485 [Canis lupus familiaris]|eukprot:XP_005616839.1 uncharacterized protein LOC102152485 [Canis lupus familiaris]
MLTSSAGAAGSPASASCFPPQPPAPRSAGHRPSYLSCTAGPQGLLCAPLRSSGEGRTEGPDSSLGPLRGGRLPASVPTADICVGVSGEFRLPGAGQTLCLPSFRDSRLRRDEQPLPASAGRRRPSRRRTALPGAPAAGRPPRAPGCGRAVRPGGGAAVLHGAPSEEVRTPLESIDRLPAPARAPANLAQQGKRPGSREADCLRLHTPPGTEPRTSAPAYVLGIWTLGPSPGDKLCAKSAFTHLHSSESLFLFFR